MIRALSILFVLAGCHRAPRVSTRSITDGLGRTIALGSVHRIVSLAPSSTEIVYALGAGEELVGVDRFSDYPAAAQKLTQVGTDIEPSVERMVALHPDLVLVATTANAQRSVEHMTEAGLTVYVSRASSLDDVFADIRGIGRAIERDAQAVALVASLKARLAAIPTHRDDPTRCAVIVWPAPLVVAGRGNHVDDLVTAAGGRNVIDDASQPFPTYSTERLVKKAPDVLLVGTHATSAPSLDPLIALASIPAVRDHRVHLIDGDLLFRPGPRVVDGVEKLAALLHPVKP